MNPSLSPSCRVSGPTLCIQLQAIIGFLWGEVPYPPPHGPKILEVYFGGVGEPKILRLPQKTREA